MIDDNSPFDTDLSALLEGRLSPAAADRVRRQLSQESRQLEADIRTLLQRDGSGLPGIEPAPASLRDRLCGISGRVRRDLRHPLRWSLSASLAMLIIALLVVYQRPAPEDTPSQAEIEQARADLAVAFSYLRQIGSRSEYYMRHEIGHTMQVALNEGIFLGVRNHPKDG